MIPYGDFAGGVMGRQVKDFSAECMNTSMPMDSTDSGISKVVREGHSPKAQSPIHTIVLGSFTVLRCSQPAKQLCMISVIELGTSTEVRPVLSKAA